ncbi:MAG: integration host factor subunit beta [Deltaproteobacteria bacterium]|nr:integration host factor subunit beta [Deltaproteobacteria bacterium]
MNKSDIIEEIAEKSGVSKRQAEDAVNLMFDSMFDSLVQGKRIELRGFGSFMIREYGSYTGRNPRTGESIKVHEKRLPFFKVGKELKEKVDHGRSKTSTPESSSSSGMSNSTTSSSSQPRVF